MAEMQESEPIAADIVWLVYNGMLHIATRAEDGFTETNCAADIGRRFKTCVAKRRLYKSIRLCSKCLCFEVEVYSDGEKELGK